MRVEKIKSAGGVAVSLGHNTRERETVNANPEMKDKNSVIVSKSVEEGMRRFRFLISQDKNPRKNAVLCLDYLITASNKSLDSKERKDYLTDALAWIRKRHGKENVVQVAVHYDENTDAHMHVLVVPLAEKDKKLKLNASKWLDGKKKLTEMQTEFAREVGGKFGLARGIEGSIAKHERVKRFYGMVNEPAKMPEIEVPRPPKIGAFYDLDAWKKKATELVFEQIQPTFERLRAQSVKANLTEEKLSTTSRTLAKKTVENGKLLEENKTLRYLVEQAPIEEIQEYRAKKAKELENQQQKSQEKGLGRGR